MPERSRDAVTALLRLRESADFGHLKVDLLEGRLIVSPPPDGPHELVVEWLMDEFRDVSKVNGWARIVRSAVQLTPTREWTEPDMLIHGDRTKIRSEWLNPPRYALLVAEIVSESSKREDREVKPRGCALAGIPFYLLIDRLADPVTVTLHSEPGQHGYATSDVVAAGGKLSIPEPFGIVLDTSTMPLPHAAQ